MNHAKVEALREKAQTHFLISAENIDSCGCVINDCSRIGGSGKEVYHTRVTFDDGEQFAIDPAELLQLTMEGVVLAVLPKQSIN